MKVKMKFRCKTYEMLPCRCCDRIDLRKRHLDRQTLKEALEEL